MCSAQQVSAGERVTNGNFGSQAGWTLWSQRGTITRNYNNTTQVPSSPGSSPCLQMSTSDGNGGTYQALSLVSGQTYTITAVSRDNTGGTGSWWAEVLITATQPSNGVDTTTTMLKKWQTSGAGSPSCNGWDTGTGCQTNLTSFTATASTMYLVLKLGQASGTANVSFDTVSVSGPDPCTPPAAPTGGSATENSATQITWGWTVVPSLSGEVYRIYDAASGGALKATSVADAASVAESGLNANTQYNRWAATFLSCESTTRLALPTRYTLSNTPGAPTVTTPTSNSLNVVINANGNPAGTQYAITVGNGGYTLGTHWVQSNGGSSGAVTSGTTQIWSTSTTITVTGLAAGTSYDFQVKARNGENVETAQGATGSGTTSGGGCPAPSAVCQNLSRSLDSGGNLVVSASEVNNGSTAGSGCTLSAVQVSKDGTNFSSSVSFGCSDIGNKSVTLRVTQSDSQTATCTATITISQGSASCSGLCATNRVTNADFSTAAGWSLWSQRGSATVSYTETANCPAGGSGNCARVTKTGDFNGGIYQQLSLVSGQTYTLSVKSRDVDSTAGQAWAEVLIGTAVPVNGTDYGTGCTNNASCPPAGCAATALLEMKWDTTNCDNWNGTAGCVKACTSFTAPASTVYIVLKSGATTTGTPTTDVSWDNVEVCGPAPTVTRTLTTTAGSGGSVTTPGIGSFQYNDGAAVPIIATADSGYSFLNWTGTGVTAGKVANANAISTTITMDGDYTVQANFQASVTYLLQTAAGAGGTITTPGVGSFPYAPGSVVSILATANSGYSFLNWSGTAVGAGKVANPNSASTTVTMDANYTLAANFQAASSCPNLLTNGGFEDGANGWSNWRADWGANEVRDFNNTEPGLIGTKCLKLGAANTVSSFGVYQQIAVTPGHTYKIDASWKGQRFGSSNWAEILLIDGPFTLAAADTPSECVQHFMYAYDSPNNPWTANFGWLYAHTQNGTAADWHNRSGLRVATGNTMTVVLKAGACCGTTGVSVWFDDVSVTETACAPVTRTLTTSASPVAGGSVTAPPTNPSTHADGTVVSINAAANGGYVFVNWTGTGVTAGKVANPNASLTTITMDGDYTVQANFAVSGTTRTLTTTTTAGGTVTSPGVGAFVYNNGQVVGIVASADPGSVFVNWTGTGVTAGKVANPNAASTTITMDADYAVQANFQASGSSDPANKILNGTFAGGLANWSSSVLSGSPTVSVVGGELSISGSSPFEAVVSQTFETGGTSNVILVLGNWRTVSPGSGIEAEVSVTDGAVTTVMYKNTSSSSWNGVMPKTSPAAYSPSFDPTTGTTATLRLRFKSTAGGAREVRFDNIEVRCLPDNTHTLNSLPPGFSKRTLDFTFGNIVSVAQNPVSKLIYVVTNSGDSSGTRLYRIDIGGANMSWTAVNTTGMGLGFMRAQGLTFDSAGNMYVSNQYGWIIKGTDKNPDPGIDDFSDAAPNAFSTLIDIPDGQLGTFHGVGGIAVGPDNRLYINSGSETHYGPESDNGFNMRILRVDLNGANLTTHCSGIRNSFDIRFRSDGKLFGVENGPLINCDYAEKFFLLEAGQHYGFPYKFASDVSGSDSSIVCTSDPGKTGPQPGGPANMKPAWGNYGPDAKPGSGQRGYSDGGIYYGFHPHSSPDGLDFYEPSLMDPNAAKFPVEFHGRAFVARFGQLESAAADVGRDLITLRLDDANEGFFCNRFLGSMRRAIDVLCAYNGRVYVLEFDSTTTGAAISGNSHLHEISYAGGPCNPDTQDPTITCPATVVVNTGSGTCTATGVDLGSATTGDNCGVAGVSNNSPATFSLGNTTVTWTVTDTSGRTATCTQTVTVQDNQNPTITCPGTVTVPVNLNACIATGVNLGTPISGDNCTIQGTGNNAPSSFPVGTTQVTWTATDNSGRTATCVQNVTVTNTSPTINQGAGPLSLNVNANTTCPDAANQIALSASDPESTTSLIWSISTPATTGTASFVGGSTGTAVTVCYQPNPSQSAADSFVVQVADGCGGSDTIAVNVTVAPPACTAPTILSAASWKAHGGVAGSPFGIPLGISPAIGDTECRIGGPTWIDVVFSATIVAVDGAFNAGAGQEVQLTTNPPGAASISSVSRQGGNTLRILLNGVPDRSCLSLLLHGIACDAGGGAPGAVMPDKVLYQRVLIGDAGNNGTVSSADINQTRSRLGVALNASNFRSDIGANGGISSSDLNQIKAATSNALISCP